MTPAQSAVVDAVSLLQLERDELRELLRLVTADCTPTPQGNYVVVIPAAVMAEAQHRINV